MKKKYWIWIGVALLIVVFGVGISLTGGNSDMAGNDGENEEVEEFVIPQLTSDERENAETMVLLDSPSLMPPDHEKFWDNMEYDGCMSCHGDVNTGSPQLSEIHYVDEDIASGVFEDANCVSCHGIQVYQSTEIEVVKK